MKPAAEAGFLLARRATPGIPIETYGSARLIRRTAKTALTVGGTPLTWAAPAQMAELVDAHGSGPCAARRGGSSPLLGTISLQISSWIAELTPMVVVGPDDDEIITGLGAGTEAAGD